MRWNKKPPVKSDKTQAARSQKRGVAGYSRKTALLEEAITQMNAGKYGRSSAALKDLLALDPNNMEAQRLFATLHLRLGSLIPARQAFDSLIAEAFQRQDYWLAESLLREYLATAPRCVPFLEKLGQIYEEKGDTLEAVAEYGKAVDILIEDPDSENPQRVSQLYGKIRDLAPASPVAFRLASFFDAQTGELQTPWVTRDPDSIAISAQDSTRVMSEGPVHLEPTDEPMPWELPNPPGITNSSGSPPLPSPPTVSNEVSCQEKRFPQEQAVPTDTQYSQKTEWKTGDTQDQISAETHKQDVVTVHQETTVSGPCQQAVSGNVPSEVVQPDSVRDVPVMQGEANQIVPCGDVAVAQDQGSVSGETWLGHCIDAPGRSETFTLANDAKVPEPPASDVVVESLTVEATDSRNTKASVSQPAEPDSQVVTGENLVGSSDSSTSGQAPGETCEPWLHPGFSWESVFNRAWKFGNQDSGNIVPPEQRSPRIDEPLAETSADLASQDPPPENQSEDNDEKDQRPTRKDATSTGTPIVRMPWDEVQESAIVIPPAQLDTPSEDTTGLSLAQSDDTPDSDRAAAAEEFADKTGLPPTASHKPDSFLIQQDSEESQPQDPRVSVEVDRGVVDTEQASQPIEEASTLMEAEQQGSLPGSSMTNGFSIQGTPVGGVAEPLSREEPFAEDQATAVDEIQVKSDDSHLRIEDRFPPADSQPPTQKDPIELLRQAPQHSQEVLSETRRMEPKFFQPEPEVPLTPPVGIEWPAQENQAATEEVVEPSIPMDEPVARQEEWQHVGAPIRFVEEPKDAPIPHSSPIVFETQDTSRAPSSAATAVDVLFESSPDSIKTETRQRAAETRSDRKVGSIFSTIHTALTGFLRTCFSTTRAIVVTVIGFMMLSAVGVVGVIGGIGLIWTIMEEQPSRVFQSLTTVPQRTLSDSKKNGYLVLLGMDSATEQDPSQAGNERRHDTNGRNAALTCLGGVGSSTDGQSSASADVMRKWFRGSDPIGQFKSHQGAIKGWGNEHQLRLDRYGQWEKLPFEDWGYGQLLSPPCATVVFAHQLHVADGFVHSVDQGVDRLETDMEAWRIVLSQARTLPMKMLALQVINDDIAVASGLLVQSDFDTTHLGRVTKLLRPLDQEELSIRWPMQSELVTASKTYDDQLQAAKADADGASTTVASMLPMPKQRRLNDYAKYYEASYKAAGEGQYGSLPKWKDYIRFPATTFMDYFTNPIENIVGLAPLPRWEEYQWLIVDTDAHLRLASLQAWLRRGPADSNLLARLAKAGQGFYDPYTGLPMLVNMKKGVLYSVGHDGKDQDGDPQLDVVVEIPAGHARAALTKSASGSSKAK